MAGNDLLTGQVPPWRRIATAVAIYRISRLVAAAYPAETANKIILDNHSAHISKETKAWLATRPNERFQFVFTPKHGSWLNLVEDFFAKAGALGTASHPRHLETRTETTHHRVH